MENSTREEPPGKNQKTVKENFVLRGNVINSTKVMKEETMAGSLHPALRAMMTLYLFWELSHLWRSTKQLG